MTIFFSLIWSGRLINENFWLTFIMVIFQLEIFMLVAQVIFNSKKIKSGGSYKNQVILRLIKFYLFVLLISTTILLITLVVMMTTHGQNLDELWSNFYNNELKTFLISWLIGITIGSLFFFYAEWNNALNREQKLREEKLIFQYETLKNQVNPHFLFNSLNSLSSLVRKDADLSERFIAKLSSTYRYILENKDKEMVSLEEELQFVKDYFYLQKIRDCDKIKLHVDLQDTTHKKVLPISLQLLIENALKHNIASVEEPLTIDVTEDSGYIEVKNPLRPKMQIQPSSKIGLKNLQERVKMITSKEVLIDRTHTEFSVKVPIITT